ncbi:pectate lyase family protein [Paenibacillus mucilaginosus]|uniref:Pectate lyase n=1 Tax=Paenibacillus mucilaginosus (strain KNP414) TaxID=1036673 RepID=F8FJT0_PAEMK|nr:pectate lyase [Paenibacillus mucilaginosus]AEI43411.1 pectate lyase [Paenibacillus mucilaginosus KNP414]MCG7212042.1 right-handed parallel beta-helix repeat-containing protein [Paenibacillus mucilaginosus]WDM24972.1 right-handed parallel beta-helix repeat-containing protein [Paenibacillus mucilaginosus]
MISAIKRTLSRRIGTSILSFALLVTAAASAPSGLLPAAAAASVFPGAQGYGVDTPAGRGGTVIKVTNLNADGAGSLKAALAAKGPRIIVFEVGGVIDLGQQTLVVSEPYVTIAGQTAPSPGITLIRGGMQIKTHDVLMKHIRFRMGDAGAAKGSGYEPDVSTYGANAYNIVIDHCSFAWGVDETLSASGPRFDGPNGTSRKLTFSNNIIAEGLHDSVHEKGPHSMGTLIHDYVTDAAIVGNLFAHNYERNPWFKGFATGVIVNNVIHNPGKWAVRLGYVPGEWTSSTITPQGPKVSIVGNYMRHGVNTVSGLGLVGTNSNSGEAYMEDNKAVDRSGQAVPQTFGGVKQLGSKPSWPASGLTVRPSSEVLAYVTQHAGARPKDRDAVDKRIVSETLNGTGRILNSQNEVGGYPAAAAVTRKLTVPATGIDEWLHQFSVELE